MPDSPPNLGVLAGPAIGAADFRYHRPQRPEDVDALLAEHGREARVLAGGTDLLVGLRSGARRPAHVIDVSDLAALAEITFSDRRLRVGATTQLWQLESNPVVRTRFAALRDGVRCVGSLQIQNRATLAGNLCNASPAADTAPALLLYDAVVGIRSAAGRRQLPVSDFWRGPGATALAPDEWVEHVTLVDPGPQGSGYVKLGRTRGVDLALVGVAALVTDSDARVACASLAPTARRLAAVEALLASSPAVDDDALDQVLASEISPITDIRASARYRLAMARVCVRRAHDLASRRRQGDRP